MILDSSQPTHAHQQATLAFHRYPSAFNFIIFLCAALIFSNSSYAAQGIKLSAPEGSLLERQRQDYQSAKKAVKRGNLVEFRRYRDRLDSYPLAAYLDYYELDRRLSRKPDNDVANFLEVHHDSYLADKLRHRWLLKLAKQKNWHDYQYFFNANTSSTTLRCLNLRARLNTGDQSAYDDVSTLWNVGVSQPDECDAVFARWQSKGHLTTELAWQRFSKAMASRNRQLAKYLTRHMNSDDKKMAELMMRVDRTPSILKNTRQYHQQTTQMQQIILHGIQRYARKDPKAALDAWYIYDGQQLFDDQQRHDTQQYLASRLLFNGHQQETEQLIARIPSLTNEKLSEGLVREALRQLDWQKVYDSILAMPTETQNNERWQYWRARSQIELGVTDSSQPSPQQRLAKLAKDRSYFSFLAADLIDTDYQLSDKPAQVPVAQMEKIANLEASLRARELLAAEQLNDARREWSYMKHALADDEHLAAAKLAFQWGWHRNTITSLVSANYWDDLQMRFPLAYSKQVMKAAQTNKVSPLLIFAIARQESIFTPDAKSPAGALGLMQLMPSTAKQTARQAGVKYNKHKLLQPDTNIHLGSYYITGLLSKFEGNRILATAAYNAGPNRVKKWLKGSADQLPYDVWIETIPYYETRKYVQNVLAYSVIYGYRLGSTPSMVSQQESDKTL